MGTLKPSAGRMSIGCHDCFEERGRVKRLVGLLLDEPVFYSYTQRSGSVGTERHNTRNGSRCRTVII